MPMSRIKMSRRRLLSSSGAAALGLAMPSISRAASRPGFPHGVQSGDVSQSTGMVWTRTDRPARVRFEWSTTESFRDATRLADLDALPVADMTTKRMLDGLPAGQDIFWRAVAADLSDVNAVSEPTTGHFRTAPRSRRDVRFVWSGDTAGQGWGINKEDGGFVTYKAMAGRQPDFFIHSGDTVYADGPMQETVELKDGTIWKNLVTPEKAKVAETLDEYRGQWKYNLLDEHVRAMNAAVPTFYQWDDHEVVNNWSSLKDLSGDARYAVKDIAVLSSRAATAFQEMTPISYVPQEPGRIYRKIGYGPMLDVFFLDMRSYRGGNGANLETEQSDATAMLGRRQVEWLKRALQGSGATWKVIASDMPLGLVVPDGPGRYEAVANGDSGAPKGRELELAELLRFIKAARIDNTVWLTADVHYTAAHHYSPERAQFQDFEPFWEFVSGPLQSGTFGPNKLDATFGPEVRFVKAPDAAMGQNLPPSAGYQFFGLVDIDGTSEAMTVRLMDRADAELWMITLEPARRS